MYLGNAATIVGMSNVDVAATNLLFLDKLPRLMKNHIWNNSL